MKKYSHIMNNWRKTAPTLWWGDPIDIRFFLADKLSELKNSTILDISCGHGIILSEVDGSNCKVGLDISLEALKSAKKINCGSNLINGNAMNLPFKDKSFDIVYTAHVVPGFDYAVDGDKQLRQNEWINEIYRILKKDGLLFLTTPNGNYPAYNNLKIKQEELKNLLSPNFDLDQIKGFNPMPIYPGIIAKMPGIWTILAFLMNISLFTNICKSFFVIAKPKK